jgi:hypothetical protein
MEVVGVAPVAAKVAGAGGRGVSWACGGGAGPTLIAEGIVVEGAVSWPCGGGLARPWRRIARDKPLEGVAGGMVAASREGKLGNGMGESEFVRELI